MQVWMGIGRLCLLRWLFRFHCSFILCAGTAENAPHSVVSFMACVLENRSWRARQRNLHRPWLGESVRVVYRKLVLERVRIEPPKALRQGHLWAGTPERVLYRKIRRLD